MRCICPASSMLLLSTRMRETTAAMARVLGSVMDLKMDVTVARGVRPNKMLKNRVPSRKALPSDSFFWMQTSTTKKTMIILTMAGMNSKKVMLF